MNLARTVGADLVRILPVPSCSVLHEFARCRSLAEGESAVGDGLFMVLPVRIELTTSPLPRGCSTTELRQRGPRQKNRIACSRAGGDPCHKPRRGASARRIPSAASPTHLPCSKPFLPSTPDHAAMRVLAPWTSARRPRRRCNSNAACGRRCAKISSGARRRPKAAVRPTAAGAPRPTIPPELPPISRGDRPLPARPVSLLGRFKRLDRGLPEHGDVCLR